MNKKLLLLSMTVVFICTTHLVGIDLVNKLNELQGVLTELDRMLPKPTSTDVTVYADLDVAFAQWLLNQYLQKLGNNHIGKQVLVDKITLATLQNRTDVPAIELFFNQLFGYAANPGLYFKGATNSIKDGNIAISFNVAFYSDLGDPTKGSDIKTKGDDAFKGSYDIYKSFLFFKDGQWSEPYIDKVPDTTDNQTETNRIAQEFSVKYKTTPERHFPIRSVRMSYNGTDKEIWKK